MRWWISAGESSNIKKNATFLPGGALGFFVRPSEDEKHQSTLEDAEACDCGEIAKYRHCLRVTVRDV